MARQEAVFNKTIEATRSALDISRLSAESYMARNDTLQRELLDAQQRLVHAISESAIVPANREDAANGATEQLRSMLDDREAEIERLMTDCQAKELRANAAEARLEQTRLEAIGVRGALTRANTSLSRQLRDAQAQVAQLRRANKIKGILSSPAKITRDVGDVGESVEVARDTDQDPTAELVDAKKQTELARSEVADLRDEVTELREKLSLEESESALASRIKQGYIDRLESQLESSQRATIVAETSSQKLEVEVEHLRAREQKARQQATRLAAQLDSVHQSPDRELSSSARERVAERRRQETEQLMLRIRRQDEEIDLLQRARKRAEAKLAEVAISQGSRGSHRSDASGAVQEEARRAKQELAHMKTRFTLLYVEHKKFVEHHAEQQAQQTEIINRIRQNIAQMKGRATSQDTRNPNRSFRSPPTSNSGSRADPMSDIDDLMSIVNNNSAQQALRAARQERAAQRDAEDKRQQAWTPDRIPVMGASPARRAYSPSRLPQVQPSFKLC